MFRDLKIAVVFQDSCVQIMYGKHIIEKVLPLKNGRERITSVREITNFDEMQIFIGQIFKEIIPTFTFLFGNLEIYATCTPLSGILEKRAITDSFKKVRCVKKVKLVEFPVATLAGLQLIDQKRSLLIDLDTHWCYITLIDNGKVILFKETSLCSIGGILRVVQDIINNSTNRVDQCWLVGSNMDIVDCYSKLRQIGFPIQIVGDPNFVTINGLAMLAVNSKGNYIEVG